MPQILVREGQQRRELDGELVGGARGPGGHPPAVQQLVVAEQPDHGVGVPYIDGQQHRQSSPRRSLNSSSGSGGAPVPDGPDGDAPVSNEAPSGRGPTLRTSMSSGTACATSRGSTTWSTPVVA